MSPFSNDAHKFVPPCSKEQGGGGCGRRNWQKKEKKAEEMWKMRQKCDRKCGLVRMVFAPQKPHVLSRLAQLGAQRMDGSMEQLSAVVQLKNITDQAQNS